MDPLGLEQRPTGLAGLVWVVDHLLGPAGCPWDREQTHDSLKPYLLEEAYETIDAIDSGNPDRLKEELGDLLLQPIMHAQIEAAAGNWDIQAVAESTACKLIRRHPHVFGEGTAKDAQEVLRNWDLAKAGERSETQSLLHGIPRGMPALLRAMEMSKRVARVGFEWQTFEDVRKKLDEELLELDAALGDKNAVAAMDELGDLLFTAVNIARWLEADAEGALHKMLDRFARRFSWMEMSSARPLQSLTPEEWETLWGQSKAAESTAPE